nr:ribonuclease H-like domain-containing protein [Tanacetum cinerariifolium]
MDWLKEYLSSSLLMNTTVLPAIKKSNIRLHTRLSLLSRQYCLLCLEQVTILNTSDHLGNFEGKANDGFLVGYAAHSKAYRVYNLSSKKVKETLNLRYLEDKPNVQGTHDTNILAGTQADDSESECDEQVILVPSLPSNSFSGPTVHDVSAPMENNLDYAEELARLQRQEYKAHSATTKHDFEFSVDTAALDVPASSVLASGVPTGSIPATSVPAGGVLDGSIVSTSDVPASSVLASGVPTGSIPATSVPAGGVLAGSIIYAEFGDPASSVSVPAILTTAPAATSPLPPGHSLGSSLEDPDWVAAMQEEMQQFYHQQVWKLVPLPDGKIAIGTKWILKNKGDARGIV